MMYLFNFEIPAGYKNMTDNTGRRWQKKIWSGNVSFISVKNFNFDEFIFKIPAGYKSMTDKNKQIMSEKNCGECVTSILVKISILMNLFYVKTPAEYKTEQTISL